ncbi:unnamed protein product [Pipistrellus nathusii]|uniref:Uncharacterized protein n=1 Tax=Pipistrellus nathusii TaxID=59473 RepID=A0ABP0AE18_PIPNA
MAQGAPSPAPRCQELPGPWQPWQLGASSLPQHLLQLWGFLLPGPQHPPMTLSLGVLSLRHPHHQLKVLLLFGEGRQWAWVWGVGLVSWEMLLNSRGPVGGEFRGRLREGLQAVWGSKRPRPYALQLSQLVPQGMAVQLQALRAPTARSVKAAFSPCWGPGAQLLVDGGDSFQNVL